MKRFCILLCRYTRHPFALIARIATLYPSLIRNDEVFLKMKFLSVMYYWPNLKNPKTFNEKLQWLKLHDRNPIYTTMVDKYEAKKYVADVIGKEYVIPTLALYDRVEDIDFDTLPDQFVMKCTHDSGGLVICKDKSNLDKKTALEKIDFFLHRQYFWQNREWPYKNITPRIIVEKYIEGDEGELNDYKFMCYNGVCKGLFVCSGREKNDLRVDFFDLNWNHLPFYRKYKNAETHIGQPENLNKMISLSNQLAEKIMSPFVRIDFYSVKGKVYFGEITFYPGSGLEPFYPNEWDYKLGELIKLPL